jgi:cell division FtsZ-interacting protein ZapD
MAQKSMLHACLADLQSRTRAQRATPARVADLRQRLQTTFASLDLSDTEVKAQTERTVTALDQALERIETDTDLRAALERQQAALETMGR